MTANEKFPLLSCRLQPSECRPSAFHRRDQQGPLVLKPLVLVLLLSFDLFGVFILRSGSLTTLQEEPGLQERRWRSQKKEDKGEGGGGVGEQEEELEEEVNEEEEVSRRDVGGCARGGGVRKEGELDEEV